MNENKKNKEKKKALITGITGQDGAFLARLLLEKDYEVHGIIRRSSSTNTWRIDEIYPQLKLYYGDVTDSVSLHRIIALVKPDEIYNLAAQSHVMVSFEMPLYTATCDALGPLNILECVKNLNLKEKTRVLQASTSEMFGDVAEIPQTETTPFRPESPYGTAKLYGYWTMRNYRDSYDLFASNFIGFNHESELRGDTFVTKKIVRHLVALKKGLTNAPLLLGNLDTLRDWGYAPEYAEAMWRILQHHKPDDFVIATNEQHTVKEFLEEVAKNLNFELDWYDCLEPNGDCVKFAREKSTGEIIVKSVKKYYRPNEVNTLIGDYSKAESLLGWSPTTKFHDLVKIMVGKEYQTLKSFS